MGFCRYPRKRNSPSPNGSSPTFSVTSTSSIITTGVRTGRRSHRKTARQNHPRRGAKSKAKELMVALETLARLSKRSEEKNTGRCSPRIGSSPSHRTTGPSRSSGMVSGQSVPVDREVSVRTRNGHQVIGRFPELRELLDLAPGAVLDGEIVLMDKGRPDIDSCPVGSRRSGESTPVDCQAVSGNLYYIRYPRGGRATGDESAD